MIKFILVAFMSLAIFGQVELNAQTNVKPKVRSQGFGMYDSWVKSPLRNLPAINNGQNFVTQQLNISTAKTWEIKYTYYTDQSLTTKLLTATIGGNVKQKGRSAIINGAFNTDFYYNKLSIKPHNEKAISSLNALELTKEEWKIDEAKNLTNTAFKSLGLSTPASACKIEYNILQVIGQELFIGGSDGADLCTEDKRPESFGKPWKRK